jgi:hypothetical protein
MSDVKVTVLREHRLVSAYVAQPPRTASGGVGGELAKANGRIVELEARLGMTPDNSSKPPSSRTLDKPAPKPKSLRMGGQRKPGREKGHPGQTLAQMADPDRTRRHEPKACRGCGRSLAGAEQVGVDRRQVFDIPPVNVRVSEHQLIKTSSSRSTALRPSARFG